MSHRAFIRLCAVFVAAIFVATFLALGVAFVTLKDTAHRGDLPVLHLGSAER